MGRPIFISTQSQFLTQNTLQISQIKVSPLDPNGKHLVLKFQAAWLCRLGEIIHQSLISGRWPKMSDPHVFDFPVIQNICKLAGSSLWMVFSDLILHVVVVL